MSPKRRSTSNRGLVDNLYRAKDKRTGRTYYRYLDKRNGKYRGLGTNHMEAMEMARLLNAAIAQQIANAQAERILANKKHKTLSIEEWSKRYMQRQKKLLANKKIKKSTLESRQGEVNAIAKAWKGREIGEITTKDCADLIESYEDRGKDRMAQTIRKRLIHLFDVAVSAGEIDPVNPAKPTMQPIAKTKRARLTLHEWKLIRNKAQEETDRPWIENAMLLALLTAQRLEDVANIKFSDIKTIDGIEYLHVTQQKTKTKVRIPTSLRMDALDLSISDVISKCRDRVVSRYCLHHVKHAGMAKPGRKIRAKTLSNEFREARNDTNLDWGEFSPPSFHEMRSLAERIYKKQGVDTKSLLGHRNQRTTDDYDDPRGHEWITVEL